MSKKESFRYRRGEVYLVEEHQALGHEQKKTRPWVLMGADSVNSARGTVLSIPLSTKVKEIPGLSIKIYVNNSFVCALPDQLRALDKRRFIRFEGALSSDEMGLIEDGLREVLAL